MRSILDECLPKRLVRELPGHEPVTVPMTGRAGILNRIAGQFDTFITIDGNPAHQQIPVKLPSGIIILGVGISVARLLKVASMASRRRFPWNGL